MSKRRKTAKDILDEVGFSLGDIDVIPFDVLAQGLSSLSEKDLLDLHGRSKYIKNRKLRAVTEEAMKLKLRNMIGFEQLVEIERLVNPVNYRLLLVAVLISNSVKNHPPDRPQFLNFRYKTTTSTLRFDLVFKKDRSNGHYYWSQTLDIDDIAELMDRVFTYMRKHEIIVESSSVLEFKSAIVDTGLFNLLVIYSTLQIDPGVSYNNMYMRMADFPPGAKIRCFICDSSAKLVCSDCNEYFCEKH